MGESRFFFSLRWKLAILFGTVFLLMHSIFSYLMNLEAKEHFAAERENIELSHINIARALTLDSYTVLEQFAEVLSLIDEISARQKNPQNQVLTALDENWSRWQLSWGMENVAFFDKNAVKVKTWGIEFNTEEVSVKEVLRNESPVYQVFCSDSCYLQTIIPLMRDSETTGAFSVIRSLADVIIKYKNATASDIGVLIAYEPPETKNTPDLPETRYKLSGISSPEKNKPIYDYLANNHVISDFSVRRKQVELGGSTYEVSIFPIQPDFSGKGPLYFLVNDISADVLRLDQELQRVWMYGLISLIGSLMLLMLLLHVSLSRVEVLSESLPLLSQNNYDQFRKQLMEGAQPLTFGRDEIDKLNYTALNLTNQLEQLEQKVRANTFSLMEKSQDLAKERDFIRQLVETAPIIIITQKTNGIILSVNQAGMDRFEADGHSIIGKVFDIFVPESDQEHLKKLNQLRAGDRHERFQINGFLLTESGKQRRISWLHTLIQSSNGSDESIILSLGVDIGKATLPEAKVHKTSGYDQLTGLINRKKFQEEFSVELATAKRYEYSVALFYLDLDHFKAINDSKGHEAGDYLLQQVAKVLKDTLRSTDLLCRFGGDEFTLIMPHAEWEGIQQNAGKIKQRLGSTAFNFEDERYQISASIGIAIFPQHGITVNELLANADLALYQAKKTGEAGYHIFSPDYEYQQKLKRMLYWQDIIENALAKDKFALFFQPVVNIISNEIHFFECLLRLQMDDGTIILPSEFIGYAQELDLIGKIDRWVVKKAVQKLIKFNRQNKHYKLSINLSVNVFDDVTIFDDISRMVNVPEVDPGNLIFEFTEKAAVSNFAAAKTLLTRLKSLGCLHCLDDFGVGFYSVYYLKHFPIDFIKFDGSFIKEIDKNDDAKVFVKAVSGLAHVFNKIVVAEYVENEAILSILKDFGIDYAQGDYLGKPVDY